jgi:hypothetical protein
MTNGFDAPSATSDANPCRHCFLVAAVSRVESRHAARRLGLLFYLWPQVGCHVDAQLSDAGHHASIRPEPESFTCIVATVASSNVGGVQVLREIPAIECEPGRYLDRSGQTLSRECQYVQVKEARTQVRDPEGV